MVSGHNDPLELIDHLGEKVEGLDVFFDAVRDNFCRRHHFLLQMAYVLATVLDIAGHGLNRGPELLHAAGFVELRRLMMFLRLLLWFVVMWRRVDRTCSP